MGLFGVILEDSLSTNLRNCWISKFSSFIITLHFTDGGNVGDMIYSTVLYMVCGTGHMDALSIDFLGLVIVKQFSQLTISAILFLKPERFFILCLQVGSLNAKNEL